MAGGLFVALAGALALLGWAADLDGLRQPLEGFGYVQGNTAAGFVIAGLATAALAQPWWRLVQRIGQGLALYMIAGSLISLLNLALGAPLGFHGFFVATDAAVTGSPWPGQSAPNSSLNFILFGAALLLVDRGGERGVRATDVLCFIASMNALTTAFAWSIGAVRIFGVTPESAMALPTAFLFLFLGPTVVFTRPDAGLARLLVADTAGGAAARRLLPAVLLVPTTLKILNHWAVSSGVYGWRFGGAAEAAVAVGLLGLLTWWSAAHLHQNELARRRGERSVQRLAALVDASSDAIVGLDLDGTIQVWNRGAAELSGYQPQEVIGRRVGEVFGAPEDKRGAGEEDMLKAMRRGEAARAEVTLQAKDGRSLEVWFLLSPIRDEEGRVTGGAAMGRDVTERRRLEQTREKLLTESRRAVRQRDEFLTVTAHELKTPLTSLLLQLESLKRRLGQEPLDREALQLRAETASAGADRLKVLVERLLELSRLHEGNLPLDLEEAELGDIAKDAVAGARARAQAAGVDLELRVRHPARGRWDRQRLGEVVDNLLENAVRYGEGQPIEVEVDRTPRGGRLAVRDHGRGIEKSDRERIFERFERASRAEEYGGIGLGLWLVREIVSAHGGDVRVEAPPDGGALFVVDLPAGEAPQSTLSSETSRE